jgi:hypothetical protein
MDKVALKTRLNEIDLAYKASCEALRWLLTETKSAVDNVDYGITDLLGKVKGGTVFSSTQQSAGTLTQRIGSLVEQHKTLSTRARPMLLEMALNYRVAVYDAYINDILEAILIHIPEKLKSGKKTLTNQEALEFSEAGTLIEYLTNQQMVEFGYESVKDQVQWILNNFGFSILPINTDLPKLVELMERRNLFVHANGIVGAKYLKTVGSTSFKVGDRMDVTDLYWFEADQLLTHIGMTVVTSVSAVFGLSAIPST